MAEILLTLVIGMLIHSVIFFQHFGNGTSTGSIGKNSLILPSIVKIRHLNASKNGKNVMVSDTD